MDTLFIVAAVIAVAATLMVITRSNAVHALLYLVVSLLAVAVVLFTLGASFAAALEVIIYAGAIMVLFIFVIMMLNLGRAGERQERQWLRPRIWIGPSILAALLLAELVVLLIRGEAKPIANPIGAREVGIALFGPYLLAVELGSMLLLAALVAAYHLGREYVEGTSFHGHDRSARRSSVVGDPPGPGSDRGARAPQPGVHADVG
ncbi:MAG: NADH-quinone oxidoreductase subunit [Rhodospirillaceae bacterium]|nr:NADH-quinone oxidoreductase subunit [Rhodospirillaceae bacterium]